MSRGKQVSIRPLGRSDWPSIEELFGKNGACAGCWCMFWRLPKGGAMWRESKGEPNRKAFRRLVTSGGASGILAFDDAEPVGWCSVAPKEDFAYFGRTRALACASPKLTWSVTCFFVPARRRGMGIASALLEGAIAFAKDQGAVALEGYPASPPASGEMMPGAFAWTGVPALFEAAGFLKIERPRGSRPIYRLGLES